MIEAGVPVRQQDIDLLPTRCRPLLLRLKLGSVRFHHERVLRVAVKGDDDHYLSPDVVFCE